MKNRVSAKVIAAVLAAVWSANATEWHVYATETDGMTGVQQLTNAFTHAVSGDTITIHAGTYHMMDIGEVMDPYFTAVGQTEYGEAGTCYYTLTPNLTVQGDPAVTPDQVVLSGAGSSGGSNSRTLRVMHLGGKDCTVRNLTFLNGFANYTRYVNDVSKGWDFRRGGGLFMDNSSFVSNCIFRSCYSQQGAAVAQGTVSDCKFLDCVGRQTVWTPQKVERCEFEGGATAIISAQGAISNCKFSGCSEDGNLGVIANSAAQMISGCEFINCTAVCLKNHTATISDCTFTGTKQFLDNCAKVVNCTFKPNGTDWMGSTSVNVTPVNKCGLENCRFEGFRIQWGSVITDPMYMRNCLITGNSCWGGDSGNTFGFTSAFAGNCEIVNCTVVGNQVNMMIRKYADSTGTITLKNTLFSNNYVGGQNWGVCDFWDNDLSAVTFYNCKLKAGGLVGGNRTKQEISGNTENLWGQTFDPKFANDAAADSLYTLRRSSPCVDAGMNEDWMFAATDLAGSKRIDGAAVDIGCYEYIRRLGTMLMLR